MTPYYAGFFVVQTIMFVVYSLRGDLSGAQFAGGSVFGAAFILLSQWLLAS